MGRSMILSRLKLAPDEPTMAMSRFRLERALGLVDARLGSVAFLAGTELTAADIMIVFSLTTMRNFFPFDLAPYPHIKAYLARIGQREAYQRAMHKGDPDMVPMLS